MSKSISNLALNMDIPRFGSVQLSNYKPYAPESWINIDGRDYLISHSNIANGIGIKC